MRYGLLVYRGISLLEFMIVLILVVVMSSLSLSLESGLVQRFRGEMLKHRLLAAIQFAKEQSQLRGETVSICGSRDGLRCEEDWNGGLLIYLDKQTGAGIEPADILFVLSGQKGSGELRFRSALGLPHLSFSHREGENNNGTFYYCKNGQQSSAWALVINQQGRVRDGMVACSLAA